MSHTTTATVDIITAHVEAQTASGAWLVHGVGIESDALDVTVTLRISRTSILFGLSFFDTLEPNPESIRRRCDEAYAYLLACFAYELQPPAEVTP